MMKKALIKSLIQSVTFVLIYSVLGYFFNKIDVSIIEYFKSELNKNLFILGLMFLLEIKKSLGKLYLKNKKENESKTNYCNHKRYCIFRYYCSDEFFYE